MKSKIIIINYVNEINHTFGGGTGRLEEMRRRRWLSDESQYG